jgi:hypothetical protein
LSGYAAESPEHEVHWPTGKINESGEGFEQLAGFTELRKISKKF